MKRPYCMMLALALAGSLAACGGPGESAPSATATPQPAATAETAPAEETPAVSGEFYAVRGAMGFDTLFNAGDVLYELRTCAGNSSCLLWKIDCASATRRVLCSVPGCTHDSESCPAWLPGRFWDYMVFAAGDKAYVYKYRTNWDDMDWDTYYQNNVEPSLDDEAAREGMTPEEFTEYHHNVFLQNVQPACLYAVQQDGSSRQCIDLSENLDGTVNLAWCDGAALYGNGGDVDNAGFRVDLASGQVTNFEMLPLETIVGAQGGRLLTEHIVTQVPLPEAETEPDFYQAVLQNSTVEVCWLDPAAGQREKVLELEGKLFTESSAFYGMSGGRLYFEERETQPGGGSTCKALRAFDLAAGQWQDVPQPQPNGSMWLNDATVVGLPGIAEQGGRYLWFAGYENEKMSVQVLDTDTGTLYKTPLTPEMARNQQDRSRLPLTDDGRFLVCTEWDEPFEFEYALIDAEAFLQGSTDYTPVKPVE